MVWRLRIESPHGFPEPPFVVAANHYSFLDPPLVGAAYLGRVRFMTLSDLFGNYRLLDLALDTFEVIEVRRGSVPLGPVRQALEHLAHGGVVAVFPEGRRVWHFGDRPYAAGAAWLAVRAGVPLVPVAVSGTDQVMGVDNQLHRGRAEVVVGPPMRAEGVDRRAVDELTGMWADWVGAALLASPLAGETGVRSGESLSGGRGASSSRPRRRRRPPRA